MKLLCSDLLVGREIYGCPAESILAQELPGSRDERILVEVDDWSVSFSRPGFRERREFPDGGRPIVIRENGFWTVTFDVPAEMMRHCLAWVSQSADEKAYCAAIGIVKKSPGSVTRSFSADAEVSRRAQWPYTAAECSTDAAIRKAWD